MLKAPKGRLKYSSGDTSGAMELFLKLLSPKINPSDSFNNDRMYLEDFRLAFEVRSSTMPPFEHYSILA